MESPKLEKWYRHEFYVFLRLANFRDFELYLKESNLTKTNKEGGGGHLHDGKHRETCANAMRGCTQQCKLHFLSCQLAGNKSTSYFVEVPNIRNFSKSFCEEQLFFDPQAWKPWGGGGQRWPRHRTDFLRYQQHALGFF